MNNVFDFLNHVAVDIPWAAIGQVIGASGVLSFTLVPVKKKVDDWFVHHKGVMVFLVGLGGVLMAALHYLLNTPTQNPGIIVVQGFVIAWVSQPFYRIIVKPFLQYISDKIANGAAFNEQVKSALTPVIEPEVKTLSATTVATSDVHTFE
jgi:hypothetical protein